jgi:hypothetical protein
MSDKVLLEYLRYRQTDCDLKLSADFGTTGYSLALSKMLNSDVKVFD